MKVRMKTLYVTPDKVIPIGKVAIFNDVEGMELVNGGYADLIEGPKIEKIETAVVSKPEKMVKNKTKPKKVKK